MIQNYNKGDGRSGKGKQELKKIFRGADSSCYRKSFKYT